MFNSIEQEALEAQEPSSRFNYTAGITDMAELEETRRREREFFDPDEVNKEVNDRLNEILSEDFVRQKVKEQWLSNPKTAKRKNVTLLDCQAFIRNFKQDKRLEVRMQVMHRREVAMHAKYNSNSELQLLLTLRAYLVSIFLISILYFVCILLLVFYSIIYCQLNNKNKNLK